MVAKKISSFGGMIPALDPVNIPDGASAFSENTWLYAGTLQGMRTPELVYVASSPALAKAFRLPLNQYDPVHLANANWIEFTDQYTDVIRSPVVGDVADRYYWACPSQQPLYNTKARLTSSPNNVQVVGAANGPFLLGVPQPGSPPGVSSSGGVSTLMESRAYVQTWVSAYGEEGPPSSPTVFTGRVDDTWAITLTAANAGDTGLNRNLTDTRIYRTVTGASGSASYFLVVDQNIASLTYNDSLSDTAITGNLILPSTTYVAPPSDLQGWIYLGNGMIAGWGQNSPRSVYFCEPYLPHAWPAQYDLTVDYDIVGMGVVAQMLIVLTRSKPYAFTGPTPAAMTEVVLNSLEPCMSRGGIISAQDGVYYPSPNGLMFVTQGLVLNITAAMATKDQWLQLVPQLGLLIAAALQGAYYAWGTESTGVFDPNSFSCATSGSAILPTLSPKVFPRVPELYSRPMFTTFGSSRSRKHIGFDNPAPEWEVTPAGNTVITNITTISNLQAFTTLNNASLDGILIDRNNQNVAFNLLTNATATTNVWNDVWTGEVLLIRNNDIYTLNFSNPTPQYDVYTWTSKKWQAMMRDNFEAIKVYFTVPAGYTQNALRDTSFPQSFVAGKYAVLSIYADDRLIAQREIRTSGELMRLPSGFRAEYWQISITGIINIKSVQFATSAKELAQV
jgi:hypothetical protein